MNNAKVMLSNPGYREAYAALLAKMIEWHAYFRRTAEKYPLCVDVYAIRHVCESADDVDTLMTDIELRLAAWRGEHQ